MYRGDTMHRENCVICGAPIAYSRESEKRVCENCKKEFLSNAVCENGHYICDECHSFPAYAIITNSCLNTKEDDVLKIAESIMENPEIKMHGPEHHYLVPAVLLAGIVKDKESLQKMLVQAQERAKNVLGGFCGFYGACGAGIGVGIFTSVFLGATPMSCEEWGKANAATAFALERIAKSGGPRCCKRDVFSAIIAAADYLGNELQIYIKTTKEPKCKFYARNKECKKQECPYYPEV